MINGLFRDKNKMNYLFRCILLAFLPIISCIFLAALQGKSIWGIYLPNSLFNDEIMYYKQIEGAIHYGAPRGFFGYNESNARLLTYSSWSPVIIYPMVAIGKLIGFGFNSTFIINIIMLTAAYITFAVVVKPDWFETISVSAITLLFIPISRLLLSAMSDAEIVAFCIIYISFFISCERKRRDGQEAELSSVVALYAVAFLLIAMRPYFVLLMIFPGIYVAGKNKKSIVLTVLLAISACAVYFLVSAYFTATYFWPIIKTEWIKNIFSSPLYGFKQAVKIFLQGVFDILKYFKTGFVNGKMEDSLWILFAVLGLIILIKGIKDKIYLFWLAVFVLLIGAVIMFYDIAVGSRHLIPFVVMAFFLIVNDEKIRKYASPVLAVLIIIVFTTRTGQDEYNYSLPVKDEALAANIEKISSETGKMISANTDNYWDNTVIWVWFDDGKNIKWNEFYGFPEGIGINMCTPDYVLGNWGNLKSKYIASIPDGAVAKACESEGFETVASTDNICIWKIR